jgi:dethiobiotin synthetase
VTRVFVAGTATEVGKTWWGRATIELLVAGGTAVVARKPAQSFAPAELGDTDAEQLARATGEDPHTVCVPRRWYEVPMAPPMAAEALGRPPFRLGDLVDDVAAVPRDAVLFVEGAGGPRSPIATDGDNVDLARAFDPDVVVLVAPAGLGTINAVRLSADAFAPLIEDGARLVVALNRYDAADGLHRRNHGWLAAAGFTLVVTPAELTALLAAA